MYVSVPLFNFLLELQNDIIVVKFKTYLAKYGTDEKGFMID